MRILPAGSLRALYSTEGFPTQAMICVNGELTKLREYQYRPVLPIFDVYGFGDGVDIRSELLSSTSGFESLQIWSPLSLARSYARSEKVDSHERRVHVESEAH